MVIETTVAYPSRIQSWIKRMIVKERIAHAYLFSGKKGAGKKRMAMYFAQSLFCQQPVEYGACLQCSECLRIEHRNHPDIHWIEPDGNAIKIDQIRDLQKELAYRGVETNRKVYIIEQVESLTNQAANSLLKFLEEPHPGTLAILLCEQQHKLLPTILSRLQQITFAPPSPTQMEQYLAQEGHAAMAHFVSHFTADMEEAFTLCQADWFAELRNLVIQLTEEVLSRSDKALFLIQEKWLSFAKEKDQTDLGLDMLLFWYRDLLYTHLQLQDKYIYIDQTERMGKQALHVSKERIAKGMEAILQAKQRLQAHVHSGLLLEQLVLRLQEG